MSSEPLPMRRWRTTLRAMLLGVALSAWFAAPLASAQDDEETPPPAGEDAEAPPQQAIAAPRMERPAPPRTLDPPPPAPIMVVARAEGRGISDDRVTAVSSALVQALAAPAGRREVHALGAAPVLERFAACSDDACYGGVLAEAGAAAGVFATLTRRGSRHTLSIQLRDPVSGTVRGEPIETPITATQEPSEALLPVLDAIVAQMPSPPPPDPTILVTVNLDGAAVSIDGISIGNSPVAPVTVASGFHEVSVTLDGYAAQQRRTQVAPGDSGRVDVTLHSLTPETVAAQGGGGQRDDNAVFERPITEEWWFWTLIGAGALLVIGGIIVIGIVAGSSGPQDTSLPRTGVPLPMIEGGMF
ncbi:MAG: PEGA domain-containing protein [Sandaracinaceae bacterium]